MNKPARIFYVDAKYTYNKEGFDNVELPRHEAYGYVEEVSLSEIVIHFIRDTDPEKWKHPNPIIKGLIIPRGAIVPSHLQTDSRFDVFSLGTTVEIRWQDVVIVSNQALRECSDMRTVGVLYKNGRDHLVIKNPDTVRVSPKPERNHPEKKPEYYMIPKYFIASIKEYGK